MYIIHSFSYGLCKARSIEGCTHCLLLGDGWVDGPMAKVLTTDIVCALFLTSRPEFARGVSLRRVNRGVYFFLVGQDDASLLCSCSQSKRQTASHCSRCPWRFFRVTGMTSCGVGGSTISQSVDPYENCYMSCRNVSPSCSMFLRYRTNKQRADELRAEFLAVRIECSILPAHSFASAFSLVHKPVTWCIHP